MTKLRELKKELRLLNKQIDKSYKKNMDSLHKDRDRLKDEIMKQDSKELLGKSFVYKNNSYSVPSKKSDYWNVYLKVIKVIEDGIKVLAVEKNSYGNIEIVTEDRMYNTMPGYVPCSKKEFDKYYKKALKEIEEYAK